MTLRKAGVQLAVTFSAMLVVLAGLFIVIGDYRFASTDEYTAMFTDVSGLKSGDLIRVVGVEVGTVGGVGEPTTDESAAVPVTLKITDRYQVNTRTQAVVRYADLIGHRYLELYDDDSAAPPDVAPATEAGDGAGNPDGPAEPSPPGSTIPVDRTAPALDLDALIGSFQPLFEALTPEQVNSLSDELIATLQGQGGTIESVLHHAASLTGAIADRDEVVGRVIDNLRTVLAGFAERDDELDAAIVSTQQLIEELADEHDDWGPAVAHIDAAASDVARVLAEARRPLHGTIEQLRRTATELDDSSDTLVSVLQRLPTAYDDLSRLGAYGDFFNYYLCTLRIKISGPDGHDLSPMLFGQDTGRCAPR